MFREKIKSRPLLYAVGSAGLILTYLGDLFALSAKLRFICSLTGSLLFFGSLLAIIPSTNQPAKASYLSSNKLAAISGIAGICLLFLSRIVQTPKDLHALIGIAAYESIFLCWSLPDTRWKELTMIPLFLVVALQLRWRMFSSMMTTNPLILAAIFVSWIITSLVVFRLIDRRKHAAAGDALN